MIIEARFMLKPQGLFALHPLQRDYRRADLSLPLGLDAQDEKFTSHETRLILHR